MSSLVRCLTDEDGEVKLVEDEDFSGNGLTTVVSILRVDTRFSRLVVV